jgi:DNA gyrase/topoisomerase IV subunit B
MADNFDVLDDAQHIRLRSGMYIGSTSPEKITGIFHGEYKTLEVVQGLLKIINEIIDNSVDEFVRTDGEYANKIEVHIVEVEFSLQGPVYEVRVKDNGRGIPIVKHGDEYQPVLAWTRARAGSNFDENRTTLGANGVGSFCTNVFSTYFKAVTADGKQKLRLECINGANIVSVDVSKSKAKGTSVTFKPDLSLFNINEISQDHLDFIHDRLENLMVCYTGLSFTFNGEPIKYRSAKQFSTKFHPNAIMQQDESNILIFAPSGESEEFRLLTYVNGLWIKNGGSHIDYIIDSIVPPLRTHIKRKHKIDVMPNQIKSHLMLAVYSRKFNNMKFDSQTKERLTNTRAEVATQYKGFDFEKIAKRILTTPEILDPMINALLFKKQRDEQLALARQQKKIKKIRVVNHIEAQSKNPKEKILFIAEGLSAIGQLLNVRDPKTVGGYPLKGKVMNTRNMKPSDIIKNKEISELMSILGLEFGKPATNINYGRIAILTDADTDGASIACLLYNFFSNWEDLFNGHIYKCQTPLYICRKGKDIKWFYTKDEFDKFNSKGYTVEYFKGLGSLPKEVYKEVINNPRLVEIRIDNKEDLDALEMAFGDVSQLRKDWLLWTDKI